MSFKLTLKINEEGETQIDFDGHVNHMVLIGALENIKHSVLRTVEISNIQAQMEAAQASQEVKEDESGEGE